MAANYLVSVRMRRTAVVEWSGRDELAALERVLVRPEGFRRGPPPQRFALLGTDYYRGGGASVLTECMGGSYDDIILDLGAMRNEIRGEWLRCGVRIMTAALSEWRLEAFLEFLAAEEVLGKEWRYAAAFGSEDARKAIENQFHIRIRRIPLSVDAFSLDRRAIEWLEEILR